MKKFFGIGLLALLTTAYFTSSCSRDEFSGSMIEAKKMIGVSGTSNGTRAFTRALTVKITSLTFQYLKLI